MIRFERIYPSALWNTVCHVPYCLLFFQALRYKWWKWSKHASESPPWSDMMYCKTKRQGEVVVRASSVWAEKSDVSRAQSESWHSAQHTAMQRQQRAVMTCQSPRYHYLPGDLRLNCGVILLESLHTAAPIPAKHHEDKTSPSSLSYLPSLPLSIHSTLRLLDEPPSHTALSNTSWYS